METSTNNETTTYIRPSDLAANGTKGVILSGIYLGEVTNPRFGRSDFKFRSNNGGIVVINNSTSLQKAIAGAQLVAGDTVEVMYNGSEVIKKGQLKGKSRHLFSVARK